MKHGGEREDAGRKPIVDELTRLKVGARCEAMMREKAEIVKAKTINETLSTLQELQEKANQIPLQERPGWLDKEAGQDYLDDVSFTLQTIQNLGDEIEPAKAMRIKLKRPWGAREEIIKKVAAESSLTERLVRTCWDEYRQFLRQSKED